MTHRTEEQQAFPGPADLRALARTSANMARSARFYQLALIAKGRTELAIQAARVAGELAAGHTSAALMLDQAACQAAQMELA